MSSSSAYNNVLLKPAVQTQAVAAAKRDMHADYASADFSQTFNELRDISQKNNDKPAKPEALRKNTSSDDSRKKIEPGETKKLVKQNTTNATKENQFREERSVKESHQPEKDDDLKVARANERPLGKNRKIDDETLSERNSKKVEDADEAVGVIAVSTTPVIANNSAPLAMTLPLIGAEITPENLVTDIESVNDSVTTITLGENSASTSIDSELSSTMSLPQLVSEESAPVIESDDDVETVNVDADETQSILLVSSGDQTETAEAGQVQANVVNPLSSNVASSPTTANPEVKATGTPLSNAVLATSDVLSTPVSAALNDKASAASSEDMSALDSGSDTDAKAISTEDPASVFKKMLQTISKSAGRDESAPVNPVQNNASTSSSSPSLLDSFARFNDAQAPATRGFVVQTTVPVPVGQPQWSQAVGEKVLWLAAQNVSSAEINLHPKDLGPMQVKVSVNQEQTSVSFTSHHPMVREVLDQNLNRLRDMFSEQGLNLVNVDVSDKSFSRQQGDAQEQKGQAGNKGSVEEETVTAVSTVIQQRLVDHYA
ncbi:MAG: flagellar hook-length control protein FliK [Gammaproteobacteria bacterium]|nr:MAG: flagellar hook-length control protein FliK [Gammaproteobacteria bacterium]